MGVLLSSFMTVLISLTLTAIPRVMASDVTGYYAQKSQPQKSESESDVSLKELEIIRSDNSVVNFENVTFTEEKAVVNLEDMEKNAVYNLTISIVRNSLKNMEILRAFQATEKNYLSSVVILFLNYSGYFNEKDLKEEILSNTKNTGYIANYSDNKQSMLSIYKYKVEMNFSKPPVLIVRFTPIGIVLKSIQ
jgi:hypothetical protein